MKAGAEVVTKDVEELIVKEIKKLLQVRIFISSAASNII